VSDWDSSGGNNISTSTLKFGLKSVAKVAVRVLDCLEFVVTYLSHWSFTPQSSALTVWHT